MAHKKRMYGPVNPGIYNLSSERSGESWSSEEKKALEIEVAAGLSIEDIAKAHKRSVNAIKIKLETDRSGTRWTPDDIKILKDMLGQGENVAVVAKALHRTEAGIESKLALLYIEELKSAYKTSSTKSPEPLTSLATLTWSGSSALHTDIVLENVDYHISRDKIIENVDYYISRDKPWTKVEEAMLLELFNDHDSGELAFILERRTDEIQDKINELNSKK